MHHPTDRITHTTAFVTPVVEHWLVREIAQWPGRKVHPTPVMKEKRLEFARRHRHRTLAELTKVLFSDECTM